MNAPRELQAAADGARAVPRVEKTRSHAPGASRRGVLALATVGACAWLAGCSVVPHYRRPKLDLPPAPQRTAAEARAQRAAMVGWWRRFDDPVLDGLIDTALRDNLDLALQAARVREARAALGLATAQFYPTLGAQLAASRAKSSLETTPGVTQGTRFLTTNSVAATLGYELNLFSALAGREAAQAQLTSSVYSEDAMRLTVVGDVVTNYMALRDVQRKLAITRETIKSRRRNLALAEAQYRYGAIDALELQQNRALLASAETLVPQLQQQVNQLESALALLTGKTPRAIMADAAIAPAPLAAIHLPAKLPALLPSDLVDRRPDIRAAEAVLVAANANVGVARAQYFPSFNLAALIGSAATTLAHLFDGGTGEANLSGGIAAPILTFGRIRAGVESAQARREQAMILYRQTVRQAFSEVREALLDIDVTQERVATTGREVDAYAKTLALARQRFGAGQDSLQDVLQAEQQLLAAQLDLADAVQGRFVATANLFKALGGGWDEAGGEVPGGQAQRGSSAETGAGGSR